MDALETVLKKIADLAGHIAQVAAEHPQETALLLQLAQQALARAPEADK